MEAFCKKLPKVELHAHLNGSLRADTLKILGCDDDSILGYQQLITKSEHNYETLDKCFHLFKVAHDVTRDKESVYLATKSVIEDFHNDNVIYLELRTTPREEINMSKKEYVESVIRAIQDNTKPIMVKLILSFDRRHDLKTSTETLELIIEMRILYPDIVKGVDLCGNPNEGKFDCDLFTIARESGLCLSLHCAEVKNDGEVLKILKFKPDRIGHATCIHPDYGGTLELWKIYCDVRIPIECCLTSNVMCGTSTCYKEHHVEKWIEEKLPFSLSTDDKGVFCTTLSNEYFLAHKYFDLSCKDLWAISYEAVKNSFASPQEKEYLHNTLTRWKNDNLEL